LFQLPLQEAILVFELLDSLLVALGVPGACMENDQDTKSPQESSAVFSKSTHFHRICPAALSQAAVNKRLHPGRQTQ
jgi:hypothetical protein